MNKIFTFWEPKEKLPGYVKLCMRTWEKYLSDSEVVVCDYETTKEYLSEDEFAAVDFRQMPLAKQSDAIRCALLKKHGGIWMDADTIITSADGIAALQQGECCMLNNGNTHKLFGAYIYAAHPGCEFLNAWHEQLLPRIASYKLAWRFRMFRFLFHQAWKRMKNWDYCVNAIIDPLAARYTPPKFVELNGIERGVIPERAQRRAGESAQQAYLRYWFERGAEYQDTTESCGLIFLHNSWTPAEFMRMSESEFLKQDIPLAKLLSKLLK